MAAPRIMAPPLTTQVKPARTFDALYNEHFDFVWRSLRRLGVHASLVEDATQDAFVVVHRRLSDLREDASAKAFLFGIALRVAHDYRRRARRKPTTSLDTEQAPSAVSSPFEHAAKAQAASLVERFMAELDDEKRAVFALADLEGMTAAEISQALNVNPNTVASRLRAARARFVSFLEGEGVAP
jgi:RNA polymerase sigma-70 factor (ECF subfamily)